MSQIKEKLRQAHRIIYMEGLAEDASRGHISVRDEEGHIYVKRWGVGFEEVEEEDFLEMDLKGNILRGEGRAHSEMPLHLEIYRRRRDVKAITHLHPFYAIILSSVFRGKIKTVSQHGVRFIGSIPFYDTAALIHTPEQAAKLTTLLGNKSVILMKNHGITVVGSSLEEAVILSLHFEKAAREHLEASVFGKPDGIPLSLAKRLGIHNYSPIQLTMLWSYYWRKYLKKYHKNNV